jgi:hypothetical protein
MQVATSIQCPTHDRMEWAEVDTRSREARPECGQAVVHLTDAELVDVLLD